MNKFFLSFADSRLKRSLTRIRKQAETIGCFDFVKTMDEFSLSQKFKNEFSQVLIKGSRGYGYWCWKPEIIAQELSQMSNGDVLLYMDAGSHLNINGVKRLLEYFQIASQSQSGILAFDSSYPNENTMGFHTEIKRWDAHFHPCYKYIKADALHYFSRLNDTEFLNSPMMEAGHLIIVKNDISVELIKEWQKISRLAFNLFDDSDSSLPNLPGFIEHRHDQAIFNLVASKYKISTLSNAETWYPSCQNNKIPDWELIKDFPIHGRRDKDFGLKNGVKQKFMNILSKISSKIQLS